MDIALFLRRKRWSLLLVVILPVVAGLLAYLVLADQPTQEVATLRVPIPESSASGFTDVNLYIENVQEGLRSTEVSRAVAAALPLSQARYREGISAERIGDAATVRIRFVQEQQGVQAQERPDPAQVVRLATRLTLGGLAEDGLAYAQEQRARAQAELDAAEERWDAFTGRTGLAEYQRELASALDDQRSLRIQIANVSARDEPGLLAQLQGLLEQAEQRAREVRAAIPEAQRIERRLDRASGLLEEVARETLRAEADVARAAADDRVREVAVTERTDDRAVRDGVVVAVATGLALALVVLVVPDLWRSAGARRAVLLARDETDPEPAGPAPEPSEPVSPAATSGTTRRSGPVPARGGSG